MNNIYQVTKLDYYLINSYYGRLLIIYAVGILSAVSTPSSLAIISMGFVISVFFGGLPFSVSEKNNLDKLYGILPLKKFEVVAGRYFYALTFGIINGIILGCLAYFVPLFLNKGMMNQLTLIAFLSVYFLYFCLSVSISYPIYYKFGFTKAYVFTVLPFFAIVIGCALIASKTSVLNNLAQVIQFFILHSYMILIIGIGLGLLLLITSFFFSYGIFIRSEI